MDEAETHYKLKNTSIYRKNVVNISSTPKIKLKLSQKQVKSGILHSAYLVSLFLFLNSS